MAITFRSIGNGGDFYSYLLNVLLPAEEGFDKQPSYKLGDGTITYGYGYTFLRGGHIYEHLYNDLSIIGITLTNDEKKSTVGWKSQGLYE